MNPNSWYALWRYAALLNGHQQALQLLTDAQNNKTLIDNLTNVPDNTVLARMPFVHNAYIAGYLGFLGLERLAGFPETAQHRQELDRLLQLRSNQFSMDSAYATATTTKKAPTAAC